MSINVSIIQLVIEKDEYNPDRIGIYYRVNGDEDKYYSVTRMPTETPPWLAGRLSRARGSNLRICQLDKADIAEAVTQDVAKAYQCDSSDINIKYDTQKLDKKPAHSARWLSNKLFHRKARL